MTQPKTKAVPLTGDAARVGGYYDDHILAGELARLEKFSPVEYAITVRYLERYVPSGAAVAEVGVGAGCYSELLARRGCTLRLIDVAKNLLQAASDRLGSAGLERQIVAVHNASATALPLDDAVVDVVLFLGPLYHLTDPSERRAAVREARRILKAEGIILAAGINRLSFLRDMFRPLSEVPGVGAWDNDFLAAQALLRRELRDGDFIREYLRTGNLDPTHAPPIGYAHLTTVAEFRDLLTSGFRELVVVGVESFLAPWQDKIVDMSPQDAAPWVDLAEVTGATPEGLAYSDHFLFIGKKN